jgi:transposase, IS5 family
MRPKKPQTKSEGDLFRAKLEQIINMRNELVQLASRIDWDWIDREIAPLYSDKGRPGIASRAARATPPMSSSPPSATTSASFSPG